MMRPLQWFQNLTTNNLSLLFFMKLKILTFPHPNLRRVAKQVVTFDQKLVTLCDNMLETMYDAKGVGLAAIQVNVDLRVVVIDVSESCDQPHIFINPETEILDNTLVKYSEGCLSVPSFYDDVARPKKVKATFQNVKGETQQMIPEGLLSVCIQHEIDHLNGKLFVDYLSYLKREKIRKELLKKKIAT